MGETGEFFGHERSDLALQNDELSVDPVIFTVFLRNPCVCNGSGSGLKIFDFGPEPRKHKNQKKKKPRGMVSSLFFFFRFSHKKTGKKIWADQVPGRVFYFIF